MSVHDVATQEEFLVGVRAKNVLHADSLLWRALEESLGNDPLDAWRLVEVKHVYKGATIETTGRFFRDPDWPTPLAPIEVSEEIRKEEEPLQRRQG